MAWSRKLEHRPILDKNGTFFLKKKKKHQKFQLRLSVLQRPIIGRIKSLD